MDTIFLQQIFRKTEKSCKAEFPKVCPLDYADDLKFWGINESFMEFCCQVKKELSNGCKVWFWCKNQESQLRNWNQLVARVKTIWLRLVACCRISFCLDGKQLWERWRRTMKLLKKRRWSLTHLHMLLFLSDFFDLSVCRWLLQLWRHYMDVKFKCIM